MNPNVRIYQLSEIQTVYKRHEYFNGTVVYSTDGYNWQSVPIDSGKWDINNWMFAFIINYNND
jgi:hypothetical protein